MQATGSFLKMVQEGSANWIADWAKKEMPKNDDKDKEINTVLANALNKVTLNEREQVYEEIHGVKDEVNETTEMIEAKLEELNTILESMPKDKIALYRKACQVEHSYVGSAKFGLMFLRSDCFDAAAAADRILYYLEKQQQFFGPDSLGRPVSLADMDKDDMKALESGTMQLLPSRDRAGRLVFCDMQNLFPRQYKYGKNQFKAFLYQVLAALEDEETQKRGFVIILYHMGSLRSDIDPFMFREGPLANRWLPLRFAAIHFCLDNTMVRALAQVLLVSSKTDIRLHFRIHEGSHIECRYKLVSFGIPTESWPLNSQGELKLKDHKAWMQKRKVKEARIKVAGDAYDYTAPEKYIDFPTRQDVLLGKGKPFQEHPGNMHLRSLVSACLDDYALLKKRDKPPLYRQVFGQVHQSGGRFLRKESGWWLEVTDEDARDKVSKTFTSLQAAGKNKKKQFAQLAPATEFADFRQEKRHKTCHTFCSNDKESYF